MMGLEPGESMFREAKAMRRLEPQKPRRIPQCEAVGENGMGHLRRCINDAGHPGPHRIVVF